MANSDPHAPATILVVDDDQVILETVEDILRLAGYSTLTASHGVEALERLYASAPDLIVSDINMPNMDGYQFYEAVRANPAWTLIPFIFLSARGQRTDIRRGNRMGADAYLVKPFEPEDLLGAVEARLAASLGELQGFVRGLPPGALDQDFGVSHYRGGAATIARTLQSLASDYEEHSGEIRMWVND